MKVLILGMDGYLGWPLAQFMAARGHEVGGCDAFFRRKWVAEMGSHSATPILDMPDRLLAFEKKFGYRPFFETGDLTEWEFTRNLFTRFEPDCVVHLGECPSAPFSMIDAQHATMVQHNNVINTLNVLFAMREFAPDAHLIKLGTMGEYGTPDIDIPEGFFDVEYRGRKDTLPFPRQAGSWYHWSKVHGSNNIMFACRLWGLKASDIMQGVVFGTRTDETDDSEPFLTRLDFDESFGTAINRFCCQAVIGHPLTVYGAGLQRRGFIPLEDALSCMTLIAEKPAKRGEYRVFNQFDSVHSLEELANTVKEVGDGMGLNVEIRNFDNPRTELPEHHYNPDRQNLIDLGYEPKRVLADEVKVMLTDLSKYKNRIEAVKDVLIPKIRWDNEHRRSDFLGAD